MTQKELLYFEDAVGHEKSIISICEDTASKLEDEELVSFIQKEIETHESLKEKLISLMEEKAHE